jgi:hypothetical protein
MVQLWTLSNKQEENLFGQEFHDKRKSKEKALVIALQKLQLLHSTFSCMM